MMRRSPPPTPPPSPVNSPQMANGAIYDGGETILYHDLALLTL